MKLNYDMLFYYLISSPVILSTVLNRIRGLDSVMKKAIASLMGSSFIVRIIGLIFTLYLARLFGASFLGQYTLFISVISIGLFLSKMGIFYALEKRISEKNKLIGNIISTSLILNILFLLGVNITILIFNKQVSDFIGISEISIYIVILILLGNSTNFYSSLLKGNKLMVEFSKVEIIRQAIPKILAILLLIFIPDFFVIIYTKIIGEMIALFYSVKKLGMLRIEKPTRQGLNLIWDITKYSSVLEIRALTFSWIDVWMIRLFLNEESVGIYQVAWQISSSLLLFSKAFVTAQFPYFSQWSANNEFKKINKTIDNTIFLMILLPIPILFGSFVLSHDVMLIFGEEFKGGNVTLIILLVCTIFRALQELYSKSLVALDHSRYSFNSSTISAGINIILNILLINAIGVEGAALATTISTGVNFIMCKNYTDNLISLTYKNTSKLLLGNIYASLIMLISLFIMKMFLTTNFLVLLILGTIIWLTLILFQPSYKASLVKRLRQVQ